MLCIPKTMTNIRRLQDISSKSSVIKKIKKFSNKNTNTVTRNSHSENHATRKDVYRTYVELFTSENLPSESFQTEPIDRDKLQNHAESVFQEHCKEGCMVKFDKFVKLETYYKYYATCMYKEWPKRFYFSFSFEQNQVVCACLHSGKEAVHEGKKYYKLKGSMREEYRNILSTKKPHIVHNRMVRGFQTELYDKGNTQGLVPKGVLQKVRSEYKSLNDLCSSCDWVDLSGIQSVIPEYLQLITLPLQVYMFTANQIEILQKKTLQFCILILLAL